MTEHPEDELKINARGLSGKGPRMMVQAVLAGATCRTVRVVVSDSDAATDLKGYFEAMNMQVEVQDIGAEFHVLVDLSASSNNT